MEKWGWKGWSEKMEGLAVIGAEAFVITGRAGWWEADVVCEPVMNKL